MKFTRRVTTLVKAMLLAGIVAFTVQAQTSRAQITGLVTDSSGAIVPNATVTLSNAATGISTVRKTSDTGLYVFDLVNPGTYSVQVEATGFPKFVQQNIQVQSGGDVTVNAVLNPSALEQSITVNESAEAVQFNTSNDDLTIDTKMANDTPRLDRNPFKLTLIEPQAINTRSEVQPYNSWSANSVDLGGGTNLKNELELDGIPLGIGQKVAYVPNTDEQR
jgi:Tfp pilus assembly major pilin PilA